MVSASPHLQWTRFRKGIYYDKPPIVTGGIGDFRIPMSVVRLVFDRKITTEAAYFYAYLNKIGVYNNRLDESMAQAAMQDASVRHVNDLMDQLVSNRAVDVWHRDGEMYFEIDGGDD